jgi:hypothetical protein
MDRSLVELLLAISQAVLAVVALCRSIRWDWGRERTATIWAGRAERRTSSSAEQSDRPEDESGQRNLAGKEARLFWMKPVVIVGADSCHRSHFGWTVEISDLGS